MAELATARANTERVAKIALIFVKSLLDYK